MTFHDVYEKLDARRTFVNRMMLGFLAVASLVAILPLIFVLYYVVHRGLQGLNLAFFTQLPKPVGETGGGLGNAVLGTLVLVTMGSVVGVPIGISAGVFLSEFRRSRFANLVRSSVELLAGVPSIILGIFAYALVVVPMHGF